LGLLLLLLGKQIDTMDIAQAVKNQQRIGTGYRYRKGNVVFRCCKVSRKIWKK